MTRVVCHLEWARYELEARLLEVVGWPRKRYQWANGLGYVIHLTTSHGGQALCIKHNN